MTRRVLKQVKKAAAVNARMITVDSCCLKNTEQAHDLLYNLATKVKRQQVLGLRGFR